MVCLKGLNNNIGLGRLITVRPLITWLGLGVYTVNALTVVNEKTGCYGRCIYKLANKYEYNWTVWKKNTSFWTADFIWKLGVTKISLRQKVSSPESAKICLRQNFPFYSMWF